VNVDKARRFSRPIKRSPQGLERKAGIRSVVFTAEGVPEISYSDADSRGGDAASAYVVEIKTVQALAFKALFEVLKELLTDVPLEIDANGIRPSSLDTSHVVFNDVRLAADRFDYFHVSEERIRIGINVL
jgi:hypothetical protein